VVPLLQHHRKGTRACKAGAGLNFEHSRGDRGSSIMSLIDKPSIRRNWP
jgi:hypothetical protein